MIKKMSNKKLFSLILVYGIVFL